MDVLRAVLLFLKAVRYKNINRQLTCKMQMKNLCVIFVVLLPFYGCSSQYAITYDSNPVGAQVVCQGVNKGYSPLTLHYSPDKEDWDRGVFYTIPCGAVWISGAKSTYDNKWDLQKFPDGVKQTVQRPNVDGYEKDAKFALEVMKYKKFQREARRKKEAREWRELNNAIKSMGERNRTYRTDCIDTLLGYSCTTN